MFEESKYLAHQKKHLNFCRITEYWWLYLISGLFCYPLPFMVTMNHRNAMPFLARPRIIFYFLFWTIHDQMPIFLIQSKQHTKFSTKRLLGITVYGLVDVERHLYQTSAGGVKSRSLLIKCKKQSPTSLIKNTAYTMSNIAE